MIKYKYENKIINTKNKIIMEDACHQNLSDKVI